MTTPLSILVANVLSGANLPANTELGELPTGTGNTPDETTTQAVARYLNLGQEELCRNGLAPLESGTIIWGIGVRTKRLTDFTPTSNGRILMMPTGAKWGSTSLTFVGAQAMRNYDPDYQNQTAATGTPGYWYREGENIGLYRAPSSSATVTVDGYWFAAPLTDVVDFTLGDEWADALVSYAIAELALKNADDPNMGSRYPEHRRRFDEACMRIYLNLSEEERAAYFQAAPVAVMMQANTTGRGGRR